MFDPPAGASVFRQAMTVDDADIDALGHASNVAYIRWVQDIAKAHSEHVGWGYPQYLELGSVFVVRRHEIDYLRPAMPGDELSLETWVEGWKAATSLRVTRIRKVDGSDVARARTTWALVSTASGRPGRIPADVREAFKHGAPS